MLIDLAPATARCDWLFLPSLTTRSTKLLGSTSFTAPKGSNRLQPS